MAGQRGYSKQGESGNSSDYWNTSRNQHTSSSGFQGSSPGYQYCNVRQANPFAFQGNPHDSVGSNGWSSSFQQSSSSSSSSSSSQMSWSGHQPGNINSQGSFSSSWGSSNSESDLRVKNNDRCKKSREKDKKEEEKRRMRKYYLEKDNSDTRNNIECLKREEEFLRQAIGAYSSPDLSNCLILSVFLKRN